jgi:hypothetical protein
MNCFRVTSAAILLACVCTSGQAAESFILGPETWQRGFVDGKEADAIYGDLALQNSLLQAVIGDPVVGRKANMTVPNVGGCIIDLSVAKHESDSSAHSTRAAERWSGSTHRTPRIRSKTPRSRSVISPRPIPIS